MATPRVGNVARITVTFQQNGVTDDPAGLITYKAKAPDLTETTATCSPGVSANGIVFEQEGVYHFDQALTLAGNWFCSFEAAQGAGQSYDVTLIQVDPRLT